MARFYATFDHSAITALDNDYFGRGKVTSSPTNGGYLKTGLISSRSALSSDMYVDTNGIENINRDGSRGVYIPSDIISISGVAPSQTFGWSPSLYTASTSTGGLQGIITPADYRTRPTASILTEYKTAFPTQFGTVTPADSGTGRNYNLYLSASNGVYAALTNLVSGSGNTVVGPYTRKGISESRTLHSIWHDADMTYFAWDDFTPGTPSGLNAVVQGDRAESITVIDGSSTTYNLYNVKLVEESDSITIRAGWSTQYLSDLTGSKHFTGSVTIGRSPNAGDTTTRVEVTSSNFIVTANNAYFDWTLLAGSSAWGYRSATTTIPGYTYETTSSVQFWDPTITIHSGSKVRDIAPASTGGAGNGQSSAHIIRVYNNSLYKAADTTALCTQNSTVPIYGTELQTSDTSNPAYYAWTNMADPTSLLTGFVSRALPQAGIRYWEYSQGRRITATGGSLLSC